MMARLYEIFSGEELDIAEKIQQRRYQMLVHSYIYYEMDKNVVSDSKWSQWAVELADLQKKYPDIANQVPYAKDFEGWDGSSGAYLRCKDKPNIIATAEMLVNLHNPPITVTLSFPVSKPPKSKTIKKKLF